jgi:hypothetical protein
MQVRCESVRNQRNESYSEATEAGALLGVDSLFLLASLLLSDALSVEVEDSLLLSTLLSVVLSDLLSLLPLSAVALFAPALLSLDFLLSLIYQPLPLKWIAGRPIRRTTWVLPHFTQAGTLLSEKDRICSNSVSQVSQINS